MFSISKLKWKSKFGLVKYKSRNPSHKKFIRCRLTLTPKFKNIEELSEKDSEFFNIIASDNAFFRIILISIFYYKLFKCHYQSSLLIIKILNN